MRNRIPILAGNWKMNGTLAQTRGIIGGLLPEIKNVTGRTVVICPPATALTTAADLLRGSNVFLGAQNMYLGDKGAFTGEIAPPMLTEIGAGYVIIGHSERRVIFGETDDLVNRKIKAALEYKLNPIICCGESAEQRAAGLTDGWVTGQIAKALSGIDDAAVPGLVFAYEPIWAIGTGKNCDAIEANRIIRLIRDKVKALYDQALADKVRILYGGSVTAATIDEQMAQSDIDGALVGGASLKPADFARIVNFVEK